MQIKTGIDIIEIERIKKSIEDNGETFLNKVFTENEVKYCESKKKSKYEHYAARFAVKEAAFKAVSELLTDKYSISWKNIETTNAATGKPKVQFVAVTKQVEKELGKIQGIDVSISHIKDVAIANVTILI